MAVDFLFFENYLDDMFKDTSHSISKMIFIEKKKAK